MRPLLNTLVRSRCHMPSPRVLLTTMTACVAAPVAAPVDSSLMPTTAPGASSAISAISAISVPVSAISLLSPCMRPRRLCRHPPQPLGRVSHSKCYERRDDERHARWSPNACPPAQAHHGRARQQRRKERPKVVRDVPQAPVCASFTPRIPGADQLRACRAAPALKDTVERP